ncbi:MAG: tetratricopeptide repeat protein [Magnetococcales bacterium]|nr:tetratricopeptide repeat protein [Magnetococcales bacterium]
MAQNAAQAAFEQGVSFQHAGEYSKAIESYERGLAIQPTNIEALNNLASALHSIGKLGKAVEIFQKAISIKPDYALVHSNYANLLNEQGKFEEAVASCQKAILFQEVYPHAYNNLACILQKQGRVDEAVVNFQKAISQEPTLALYHYNLANAMQELGKLDKAVLSYQKAIEIDPKYIYAYNNLGKLLQEQGKTDAAIATYQKAISIDSSYAEVFFNLSLSKKFSNTAEIEEIQIVLSEKTDKKDKIFLNFALGKAMADIHKDEEAFKYYNEGNRLKRETFEFDISEMEKTFNNFKKIFNQEFFLQKGEVGCTDNTPIFILGMPRSGTTLIEQILASHNDVYGAGELPFVKRGVVEVMSSNLIKMIPYTVSRLKAGGIKELGEKYIKKIRKLNPDVKFITDKMPDNFLYIGLIRLMLPNAKIIHSVRSAKDTCLSIYRLNFVGNHHYAYNFKELGEYYRLYTQMMTHWHTLFHEDIYQCHYEKLTTNQEEETRKLLDFCGLEWSENCLDFHKTKRDIKTSSNLQVRQKMYTSSVNGWQRFERQLQPLIVALGDLA